jgi:hypothetical protein
MQGDLEIPGMVVVPQEGRYFGRINQGAILWFRRLSWIRRPVSVRHHDIFETYGLTDVIILAEVS